MKPLTEIGQNVHFLVLLPFLAIALVTDLSRRHIPNLLIVYMLVCGVAVQVTLSGPSGLLTALGGAVVGLLVLLPFYAVGGMGAGDVKLLGAAGTLLGPDGALLAGALTLGAGGLLALAVLVWHALARIVRRRPAHASGAHVGSVTSVQLPYSLAIAAGTLTAAYNASGDPFASWISSW